MSGCRVRRLLTGLVVALLAGCGGGGSYNLDDGVTVDEYGRKVIRRSLENRSDRQLWVDLWVNGSVFLDTVELRPHSTVLVTIEDLRLRDAVRYRGEFEGGGTVSGSFSEDGRTVFTYTVRSEGTAPTALDVDGEPSTGAGVVPVRLRASQPASSPPRLAPGKWERTNP